MSASPDFVKAKDTLVRPIDQMWDRQERGPTRLCPRGAAWRNKGPTAGSGEFQKPGAEEATESSKVRVTTRSRELQVREIHKSTAWSQLNSHQAHKILMPEDKEIFPAPSPLLCPPPSILMDLKPPSAWCGRGDEKARWRNTEVNCPTLQKWRLTKVQEEETL